MRALLTTIPGTALLAVVALAGCFDVIETDLSDTDVDKGSAAMTADGLPLPAAAGRKAKQASLAQGESFVLGLRVPDGMAPGAGPHLVYRFEGLLGVEEVAAFVREQVNPLWEKKEGSGVLFEKARVKQPVGGTESPPRLNIRVFRGRKGGATLDVWDADRGAVAAAGEGEDGAKRQGRTGMSTTQRQRRQRSIEETHRVMDKINRGEPLDKKDLESPFFQ